jgi:hypothetical protein
MIHKKIKKVQKYIKKKRNSIKCPKGIVCYAVGGPQNYRNLRALLLNKCVESMGLNIEGSFALHTKEIGP